MASSQNVVLAFGFLAQLLRGESSKEAFYTQAMRLVVRLEQVTPNGGVSSRGTGFFATGENNQLFIVTARHVADCHCDLRARVPLLVVATRKTEVIELRMPSARWVFHPLGGNANTYPTDVAVMKIPALRDRTVVAFHYCKKDCASDEDNQLDDNPAPPDHIVILGYPADGALTLKQPRPMAREGVVSLISDDPFIYIGDLDGSRKLVQAGAYLIDAHMFPGNSGGPIVVFNPPKPIRLGGLVTASNPGFDYGVVTGVKQIEETLDRAENSDARFYAWFMLDPPQVVPRPIFTPYSN